MGNWSKIKILSLKNNGLTSLPPTLGVLSDTLEQLELDGNKLIEPPPEIVELGKDAILKHLHDMLEGITICLSPLYSSLEPLKKKGRGTQIMDSSERLIFLIIYVKINVICCLLFILLKKVLKNVSE
jgi:hypothetical protein